MSKSIQAATGLLIAVFVAVHLLNTWLAALGADAYNAFQSIARPAYQQPFIEALLLGAIVLHLAMAAWRWRTEPKRPRPARSRWHRNAGVFLLVVMGGHITAVRGPSWFANVYPGFEGLAFTVAYAPLYFYPYYFLLALAGFYHALNGTLIAGNRLGRPLRLSGRQIGWATAAAGAAGVLALAGFGGLWTAPVDVYDNDFARLALAIINGL